MKYNDIGTKEFIFRLKKKIVFIYSFISHYKPFLYVYVLKKSICIKINWCDKSIHLSLRVYKSMLIDIGCQKKYMDFILIKFFYFLIQK